MIFSLDFTALGAAPSLLAVTAECPYRTVVQVPKTVLTQNVL